MAERGYEEAGKRMVDHLRRQGVSEEVLGAMMRVKRHLFVPPNLSDQAYNDYPLPIGEGRDDVRLSRLEKRG
jgi:protein-L-isoaspartate(D-aspartate) O-methyltransferase